MHYTGKDRVLMAFEHKKADRLPVFDVVNKPDMYPQFIGESNYESHGRQAARLAKKLGIGDFNRVSVSDVKKLAEGDGTGRVQR